MCKLVCLVFSISHRVLFFIRFYIYLYEASTLCSFAWHHRRGDTICKVNNILAIVVPTARYILYERNRLSRAHTHSHTNRHTNTQANRAKFYILLLTFASLAFALLSSRIVFILWRQWQARKNSRLTSVKVIYIHQPLLCVIVRARSPSMCCVLFGAVLLLSVLLLILRSCSWVIVRNGCIDTFAANTENYVCAYKLIHI